MNIRRPLRIGTTVLALALCPRLGSAQTEGERIDPEIDDGEEEVDRSSQGVEREDLDEEAEALSASEAELLEDGINDEEDLVRDALFTPFGAQVVVGGGVRNFTQTELQDATSVGGYWDVRGTAGTRTLLGAEVAYHGTSQDIEAIGLRDEAFLVSNGIEGAVRLNAPITLVAETVPILIEPFALGGIGWARYSLFNEGVNTSDVVDQDDIVTLPLGVGLALGVGGITLDGRFTYRHAFESDLLGDETDSFGPASLNSWSLGGSLGFEF